MDYDTWIDEQDDDIKTMLAAHTDGLRSALDSERDARKVLAADLKTAVASSTDAADMRQKLDAVQADLASAANRAEFYATGHKAGVTNLSLAFLAAKEGGLVGDDGVDFEQLKVGYPELFAGVAAPPAGNAGSGMAGAGGGSVAQTMDGIIRGQAGVG